MKKIIRRICNLAFLISLLSISIVAQEKLTDDEAIKIDTLLLNVPVIVSDKTQGRYISGLRKENFYIIENGIRRDADFFADSSAPLNVAILIDTSNSTVPVMKDIKEAARDFIQVLRPEDQAMIASFDYSTKIWSEFTNDKNRLERGLDKLRSSGASILFDSMYLLMKKHFAPLTGRKAIIVLTDGEVAGRGVSERLLLNSLAESDILIYPIVFEERVFSSGARHSFGPEKMNRLALVSGGKTFSAAQTNFKTAFQNIADELKNQYVVGFYPSAGDVGKSFKVGLRFAAGENNPSNVSLRIKKNILPKSALGN